MPYDSHHTPHAHAQSAFHAAASKHTAWQAFMQQEGAWVIVRKPLYAAACDNIACQPSQAAGEARGASRRKSSLQPPAQNPACQPAHAAGEARGSSSWMRESRMR
jgi:hypothetical protein